MYVIGALFDDRPTTWIVVGIGALMTLLCVMAGGAFVLDVLQLKGRVPVNMEGRYTVNSGLALAKLGLSGFAALVVTVSAFRAGRSVKRASRREAKRPSSVIVSSSSSTALPGGPA